MTNLYTIVPIVISVLTFILTLFMTRKKISDDYIASIERRFKDLDERLQQCEAAKLELVKRSNEQADENIRLLRQLVQKDSLAKKVRR